MKFSTNFPLEKLMATTALTPDQNKLALNHYLNVFVRVLAQEHKDEKKAFSEKVTRAKLKRQWKKIGDVMQLDWLEDAYYTMVDLNDMAKSEVTEMRWCLNTFRDNSLQVR